MSAMFPGHGYPIRIINWNRSTSLARPLLETAVLRQFTMNETGFMGLIIPLGINNGA